MDEAGGSRLVLVVEDDPLVRQTLRSVFERGGLRVTEAPGVASAFAAFRELRPDVILADQVLEDGTALELLDAVAASGARVPVVVLSGQGSIGLAVEAMKRGAYHFLAKPAPPAELLRVVGEAIARSVGRGGTADVNPLSGSSSAIRRLAIEAECVASGEGPVLIQGETGSGKSALALWIHQRSPRARGPFVAVDCAGLSREASDAILFGGQPQPVVGPVRRKPGLVYAAHGGTLLLDEVGDLDIAVQAKLLNVLEEGREGGGSLGEPPHLRLVATTQHDLRRRVAAGAFRQDLLFRVCCLPILIPPLRERPEDVPVIASEILGLLAARRRRDLTLSADALERLKAHRWPGNVRELRNVLERALLLTVGGEILAGDLRFETTDDGKPAGPTTLAEIERAEIERTLAAVGYRVREAARRLGIPRSTLYQRLKRFGIVLPRH